MEDQVPKIQEVPTANPEKGYYKKKKEDKKPKPQKEKIKSQYEYNAEAITETTVIPALPKKNQIIPRPQLNDFRQRETKIRDKIYKLLDKKKQIRSLKFQQKRKIVKGEQKTYDIFKVQLDEAKDFRERLMELKKKRNQLRDKLNERIEEAKANNAVLKNLYASFKGTRESMHENLRELEHRLTTAQLTKQEQKSLNNQIMIAQRAIKEADSSENLQLKLQKAEAKKEELDDEIQRIKQEKAPYQDSYNELKKQLDSKSEGIDKLKGNIETENTEKTKAKEQHDKQYEEWKEDKKKKLLEIDQKIKKHQEQCQNIWTEFEKKKEDYWKQKHYIDFIEWQMKVQKRKIEDRLREQKRKMYEQKDKERQIEEKKQKYIKEIQLCNFLINYCRNIIAPNDHKEQQHAQIVKLDSADIEAQIAQDAQWKKQKGVQVIQSKKSKIDEEPAKKKNKKEKKKVEQKKQQKFDIPYNVQVMFDTMKVFIPNNPEDVERAIKDLKERQELFNRACNEEIDEKDKETITAINGKNKEKNNKKVLNQEEFPGL